MKVNPITLKGNRICRKTRPYPVTSTDWQQIGNRRVFNIIAKDVDDLLDSFTGEPIDAELCESRCKTQRLHERIAFCEMDLEPTETSVTRRLFIETIALGNLKAQSYVAPVNIAHYLLVDINKVVTVAPPSAVE